MSIPSHQILVVKYHSPLKGTRQGPLEKWLIQFCSRESARWAQGINVHSCHLLFDHFQFALIHRGMNVRNAWHSRFLCNIGLYSIRPCFYHQSHPQLGTVFALAPSLHFFWSYSPLISSSLLGLGSYWPGNLISGSSAFSKSSLNIRMFTVHVLLKYITLLACEMSTIVC